MKIPIPEIDERYDSTEDALEHLIRICDVLLEKAMLTNGEVSVNNIPGYLLAFCEKVLTQARTFLDVVRKKTDFSSAMALLRILTDNISIIKLIYTAEDSEERVLRHLLYVIDGVNDRLKLLESRPLKYDGSIPLEVYNELNKQVQFAKENCRKCIDLCVASIKRLHVYTAYQLNVDALIRNNNWKYKNIERPRQSYTWKEMYCLLDIRDFSDIFSYLSQYIHGLSVSNILIDSEDDFEPAMSFAYCLIGWLFTLLRRVYEPTIVAYTWEDIYRMCVK